MKKLVIIVFTVLAAAFFSCGAYADCGKGCCKKSSKSCGTKDTCGKKNTCGSKDPTKQSVVVDPACGMDVNVADAKYSTEYKGKKYYFCNKACKKRFIKDPDKYIGPEKSIGKEPK